MQSVKVPDRSKELPVSYSEAKCKNCKSVDLDYGKYCDATEIELNA